MKKIAIALLAVLATLPGLPVKADPVRFGYADNGLSLKGLPQKDFGKQFGKSSVKDLLAKGTDAFSDLRYLDAANYYAEAITLTNDPEEKEMLKKHLFAALKVGGNSQVTAMPRDAIFLLDRAIKMNPNDYFLYARRGDAYCNLRQVTQCVANHKIALKLNPSKGNALRHMAQAFLNIEPSKSAKLFDLSVMAYKKEGDAHNADLTLWVKNSYGL
jgi:tetratricopeptide (TPR) repeat protein